MNVELAIRLECHGLTSALRSLPSLAGRLLSVRPTDALRLLSAPPRPSRGGLEGDEWHALASRMDTELDHVGTARLLASHTPHESCVRTPPVEARPIATLPLLPLQSVVLRDVPLARPVERVVEAVWTRALQTVDRLIPAFASPSAGLGLRAKSKTD